MVASPAFEALRDPARTKSTAYSREERNELSMRGLLPYAVTTLEIQKQRVLKNLRRKRSDIERYEFLLDLQDRNETLFFRVVVDQIEELMPIIYTPTVGEACQEFSNIFRRPRGLYITPDDRGQVRSLLENWPEPDVQIIVVTDGERVLGLGDLGANGMGISIGKLSLYTACAGIHPRYCLPVMLDVGTNNVPLRTDPLYLGYPRPRLEGDDYFQMIDEFMQAVREKYPRSLVQFEDFQASNAFELLNRYASKQLCFNDDIQGTAAATFAGILTASRATGKPLTELKIMFLGAGSAALGIGDLLVKGLMAEGLAQAEAQQRLSYVDLDGLIVRGRDDLSVSIAKYARDLEPMTFMDALDAVKPDVLIGATGAAGAFSESVVRKMAELQKRPVIFALSNPSSCAECSAEDAYYWSNASALFCSGSPFDPVMLSNGCVRRPGQCNNAFIFPGIGLGALIAGVKTLPDELFLSAAHALADCVEDSDLEAGALFPRIEKIRAVADSVATAVAKKAFSLRVSFAEDPSDLSNLIERRKYDPKY
ncbi:MAG: NAD-dependent malic enzyme [Pseudomonadota bacterium]